MPILIAAVMMPLPAASQTDPASDKANFNFKNTPPQAVLEALGQLYGVQFASDVTLTERITISSGGPVSLDEMVTLLDVTLRRQGASARLEGGVVRIVPVSLAAARVEMVHLKHADPTEVAKVVEEIFQTRDLLSATTEYNTELVKTLVGELDQEDVALLTGKMRVTAVPYPRLKAVVIKAPEVVIGTIKQFVVSELDKPLPAKPAAPKPSPPSPPKPVRIELFKLNYVPASYVGDLSEELLGFRPLVESRTNTLILRTDRHERFEQLKEMIQLFDKPESLREETYHFTLNNATADEVRDILNQFFARSFQLPFTEEGLEALTGEEREKRIGQATDLLTAAGVDAEVARDFVQTNLGVPFGTVHIVADTANNAMLIRTNPKNYDMLLRLIEQLDQPRTQVFIKVFIAEVTLDDTLEMGLDFIYTDFEGSRSSSFSQDFDVSLETTGLSYSFISSNIETFFRLLQTTTTLDVIQRPQITTLDNQKAEFEFGQRVPLLQTTQLTSEGTTNSTVRYENVTTKLVVTPHVNAAGFVRMEIAQYIDDVSSDTFAITENLAPRILITRKATTTVQVRDGQTICLGGFVGDSIDDVEEKVPVLGDIPGIGELFKNVTKTRTKSEMLIFITPYILRTPQELLAMTNQRRQETVVARRDDHVSEELHLSPVPEPNPYRPWGNMRNSYSIPAGAQRSLPAEPLTVPQTQPAVEIE